MTGDLFGNQPGVDAPTRAGEYLTLMADPPWKEAGGGKIRRGANRHYPLMHTRDICALPAREWMAPNAHCYLWVTNNFIEDGLEVLKAWNFRYITIISWFKSKDENDEMEGAPACDAADDALQMGIGKYFRGCTEHVLFGVRGVLPYRTLPNGKRAQGLTGFHAPRTEHSVKPAKFRQVIERVSPGPYLEMFARQPVEGWDVWGNESTGERLAS